VTSARAVADEPGESDEARVLVLQAIALVVNTPDDMMAIDERITDALEAPKPEGVDRHASRRATSEEPRSASRLTLRRPLAHPANGDQDPKTPRNGTHRATSDPSVT
jgi:hypothetical protein